MTLCLTSFGMLPQVTFSELLMPLESFALTPAVCEYTQSAKLAQSFSQPSWLSRMPVGVIPAPMETVRWLLSLDWYTRHLAFQAMKQQWPRWRVQRIRERMSPDQLLEGTFTSMWVPEWIVIPMANRSDRKRQTKITDFFNKRPRR